MAIIRLDCNLNGGDSVTPNNELFYRIYGDINNYASPIHTTGPAITDYNVTVDNDRVIITGVDGTTNTSFKIASVDGSGNEAALSDAVSSSGGYLFNDYADGFLGFSFRKLKDTATDCVTIRRGNDQAETTILLEDTGFISLSSIVSAGGTLGTWAGSNNCWIKTWHDQSGNGYDITQTNASNQPYFIDAGVINLNPESIPSALFDGASDYLERAALTELTPENPFSYFTVANNSTTEDSGIIFSTANTSSSRFQSVLDTRTTPNRHTLINSLGVDNYINLSVPVTTTDSRLMTVVSNGYQFHGYHDSIDDGLATPISPPAYGNTTFQIGRTTPLFLEGNVSELVLFSTDKTATRASIESSIKTVFSTP